MNNPTNLVDPLGLSEKTDERLAKHEGRLYEMGLQATSTCALTFSCMVFADSFGMQIDSGTAMQQLNMGTAVVCPQCGPGDVVDAGGDIYRWIPQEVSGNGTDTLGVATGYWEKIGIVGSFAGAAKSDNWWGNFGRAFVNGVLHGIRQSGQSFSQCVLQNANETTGGAHGALLGAVATSSVAAISNLTQIKNSLPVGPATISVSNYLSITLGRSAGSTAYLLGIPGAAAIGANISGAVSTGLSVAGRAAPYLAAAEAGLLIGSAINCR